MKLVEKIFSDTSPKKRMKMVPITLDVFFHCLREGYAWKVEKGIPKDAQYRGFTSDPRQQIIYVWVEHPSFPEVDAGSIPNELRVAFTVFHEEKTPS